MQVLVTGSGFVSQSVSGFVLLNMDFLKNLLILCLTWQFCIFSNAAAGKLLKMMSCKTVADFVFF